MDQEPKGLRLVEKTVEVLDLLAERRELTAAQLAELTGEPRSSVYRLLARLEQLQLVESGSSRGSVRLGTHLLRWGVATQAGLDVRERALPVMEQIRAETGLTIYLVVRRGREGVCVERLEGLRVASMALKIGGSLPLHAGAAPRALLAFEPESEWESYATGQLASFTDSTPVDAEELYRVLREEREHGYTVSDGDVTVGIASIGAPIRDHHNVVQAALSVSGLRDEVVGANADEVRRLVIDGAATISRALGASAAAPPG